MEYGERFADTYRHLLIDTAAALEREDKEAPDKIRRFNIIFETENNDFERALTLTNRADIKAEICMLLGPILHRLDIYNKALDFHKKSKDINKTLGDKSALAKDYSNIGWIYSKLYDPKKALEYHNYALNEYKQLNDATGMAREFSYIGLALSNLGKHEEAIEYHDRAITIDREINDDKKWLAEDYENIATTFYNMREYRKALDHYKISLEIYNKVADRLGKLYCFSRLGRTYEAMGDHEQALEHHYKALEMRKEMGYKAGIAREYYYISFVLYNKRQENEAIESLMLAKCILEEFNRQTGYRHPMLGQVLERITFLQSVNGKTI
jgi:tetratricopeptide (TPR) repeat protein